MKKASSNFRTFDLRLSTQKIVYFLLALFFSSGAVVLMLWDKNSTFLYINGLHTPALDIVFPYITYAGDGWLVLFILIILLFIKFGYALDFVFSALLSLVFVQLGKRVLFADVMRPFGALGEDLVHIIEGVNVHSARSFPSGHSTTAMLTFFYLAIISKSPALKFIFILIAFAGGYSRIYLSQHYFTDVYVGFWLGVLCVSAIALIRNKVGETAWYGKKLKAY